jgi:hypothetical protein
LIQIIQDVLSHSTNLLAQFSAALTHYASYEEQIRSQMKSIRSREEDLDEMKRRKRNVDHKADSADKKLAKMNAEVCLCDHSRTNTHSPHLVQHKGRMGQVELLNELKEEGRRLEIDIVNEEVGSLICVHRPTTNPPAGCNWRLQASCDKRIPRAQVRRNGRISRKNHGKNAHVHLLEKSNQATRLLEISAN